MENNIFMSSISMSWRILDNRVVVRYGTCQLDFFGKKLGCKLVFGMSIYHFALQSPSYYPDFLGCFVQPGLELELP